MVNKSLVAKPLTSIDLKETRTNVVLSVGHQIENVSSKRELLELLSYSLISFGKMGEKGDSH